MIVRRERRQLLRRRRRPQGGGGGERDPWEAHEKRVICGKTKGALPGLDDRAARAKTTAGSSTRRRQ
jgi:hypothetical protein